MGRGEQTGVRCQSVAYVVKSVIKEEPVGPFW